MAKNDINIIYELPNNSYHYEEPYSDFLSSSKLKAYTKSPLYAHLCMTDPAYATEVTPAMLRGTRVHDGLEFICNGGTVEGYLSHFAVFSAPINEKTGLPYGATTNAYKDAFAEFTKKEAEAGRTVLAADELEYIRNIVTAASSNEYVRRFISNGKPDFTKNVGPEISFFWTGETPNGNELKIKCRPDLLTRTACFDYKTTSLEAFTDEAIGKVISDYDYGVSGCLYQYVLWKVLGKFYEFVWIFISTKAPYEVAIAKSSNICFSSIEDLEMFDKDTDGSMVFNPSVMKFRDLLHTHIACIDANHWPGSESWVAPDESGIRFFDPKIPAWEANKSYKSFI